MYNTFNPRLLDDPLSPVVCQRHYPIWEWRKSKRADIRRGGYDWGRHRGFPDYKKRAALLQSNPIEQARGFDRIATAVVELLVGLKLRAGQPGRGSTSRLPSQQPRGIFLRSKALY